MGPVPAGQKGTQVWTEGVAVFNRVLYPSEVEAITFTR
jgi:hypothetical protein